MDIDIFLSLLAIGIFAVTIYFVASGAGAGRRKFRTYKLDDLKNGRASVDMCELNARMTADRRRSSEVCREKCPDGPTPCWWPFCDCGE